jgi:hypothetical protein
MLIVKTLFLLGGERETRAVANEDTKKGEGLSVNYRVFDAADAASTDPYLDK